MKVHLIKKQTIETYILKHASSKPAFSSWLTALKYADWEHPSDIQQTFGSADLLGGGTERVVFNIAGNNHRLIAKYAFGHKQIHLFICWLGTHAEYTKLCIDQKQYTVTNY